MAETSPPRSDRFLSPARTGLLEREEMLRRGRRWKEPLGSGHRPDSFVKGQLGTPPPPSIKINKPWELLGH